MAPMNLGDIISELQRRESESANLVDKLRGELRLITLERDDLERKAGRHASDAEGLRRENGKLVQRVTELTSSVNGELYRCDYVRGEDHRLYVDRVAEQDRRLLEAEDALRVVQEEADTAKGDLKRLHERFGYEVARQIGSEPVTIRHAALAIGNSLRIMRLSTELKQVKQQRNQALARLERFGEATAEALTLLEGTRSWGMDQRARSMVGNAIGVLAKAQQPSTVDSYGDEAAK